MMACNSLKELLGEIFGVRRCEPKSDIWEGLSCFFQKMLETISWEVSQLECLREARRVSVFRFELLMGSIMIAVHILAQQGDLLHPLALEPLNLRQNRVDISASLSPPHKGHDTERAHIITASHNGKEGERRIWVFPHWSNISIRFLDTQLHINAIFMGQGRLNQIREIAVSIGSTHNMDPIFEHLFLQPLSHAPQDPNHLAFLEFIDAMIDLLFCCLSDRTSIDQHYICIGLGCLLVFLRKY